jgi:hypothetical protein
MKALKQWKKEVYPLINLEEARNPINPLKLLPSEITETDIENLKKWASVRTSVGASVWDSVWASVRTSVWASVLDSVRTSVGASVLDSVRTSVGASVRDSVWASVWDSVGASIWDSVRTSVRTSVGDSVGDSVRDYIGSLFNIWDGDYKYQPVVDLWKRGFVASFDGKTWRLHSGKNTAIVYEWKS